MKRRSRHNQFRVQLYEHSSRLPGTWDLFLPQNHFLKTAHLTLYENAALPDITFQYALVMKAGKPVAAIYFQALSIKPKHLNEEKLAVWQRWVWKAFTKLNCPKLLVAGHLFRHDVRSFYRQKEISDYEAYQIYRKAIKKALLRVHASAVLVKDLDAALIPYFEHYAPDYLLLRNDISMEMNIRSEWKNMDDYEQALKHKYAQRYRKIRQSWTGLDVRELSTKEVEEHKKILFELYQQVSSRQPVRLGLLSEDFLPALKKKNDNLHVWLVWHDGEPVAFFSAWEHGDIFDMFYIGWDYVKNDTLQLYFNILFFSIEQAITLNKSRLVLGRTAAEAKARLGCKPRYLSTYLYISNFFLRKAVQRLQQKLNDGEGEWENRHPFRKG